MGATGEYKVTTVRCMNKMYKNNKVYAYEILDSLGTKLTIQKDKFKEMLDKGQIRCINLDFTQD